MDEVIEVMKYASRLRGTGRWLDCNRHLFKNLSECTLEETARFLGDAYNSTMLAVDLLLFGFEEPE